jgi:hypothetical protein
VNEKNIEGHRTVSASGDLAAIRDLAQASGRAGLPPGSRLAHTISPARRLPQLVARGLPLGRSVDLMKLNALMVRYIVDDIEAAVEFVIWDFASLLSRDPTSRSSRGKTCNWC